MIMGQDGRRKVQMRIDLGLMQMELHGRPDGKRPYGYESLLEYYLDQLETYRAQHGSEEGFVLTPEDCDLLRQEALQYYYRYLSLFHLGEFELVERDTTRNLKVFDLIWEYAEEEEDRWSLEQYRPYVIMMHTRARAEAAVAQQQYKKALALLEEGMEAIREFFRRHSRPDLIPESRELQSLQQRADEIQAHRPLSRRERLERLLEEAVEQEDYERAARLRDELARLSGETG